jgi:hypothetical protein
MKQFVVQRKTKVVKICLLCFVVVVLKGTISLTTATTSAFPLPSNTLVPENTNGLSTLFLIACEPANRIESIKQTEKTQKVDGDRTAIHTYHGFSGQRRLIG